MVVVVAALLLLPAQADDLGGGAPVTGPSAADLGALEPAQREPPAEVPATDDVAADGARIDDAHPADRPVSPLSKADSEAKARKLRADVDAALGEFEDDPKASQQRLEALAGQWVHESVFAADPALKPLLRLVRARALTLAGRFDEATAAVNDARKALDHVQGTLEGAPARRLAAAIRFHAAAIVEARARPALFAPTCGGRLGLRRLAQDEARRRRKLLDEVAAAWAPVARGNDRFWGRRAAARLTALYEEVARLARTPGELRAVSLPSPYAFDVVDTAGLVDPALSAWLGELRRAWDEIGAAIDARDPDPVLAARIREHSAALARFVPDGSNERVENPWRPNVHEGLVRVARRPERRNAAGRFVPIETRAGIAAMANALERPAGDVDAAFALVGLAEIAPDKLPVGPILAALGHADERMVVAGLIAAAFVVDGRGGLDKAPALREAVVLAYLAAPEEARRTAFSTMQGTLYGRAERALLALQAIARVDRASAEALVADERLPAVERVWLVAELADPRFAARFDGWAWDKDDRVAALAIFGGVIARGKNAAYLLRPSAEGLIGCASRAAVPE